MSNDWRYNFQHVGDLFIGMFEATVYAAKRSAASIVIDYQVNNLGRKKDKVATRIGNRVVDMRKNDPELLTYDPQIAEFYEELDLLQEQIDENLDEKQEMKARWDSLINRLNPNCQFDETCDKDMSSSAV